MSAPKTPEEIAEEVLRKVSTGCASWHEDLAIVAQAIREDRAKQYVTKTENLRHIEWPSDEEMIAAYLEWAKKPLPKDVWMYKGKFNTEENPLRGFDLDVADGFDAGVRWLKERMGALK